MFKEWQQFLNEDITEKFPYQIYCDMDGVLVDLPQGVLDAAHLNTEDKSLQRGVTKILAQNWSWQKKHPNPRMQLAIDYIDELISNNIEFWSELPPTQDKDELWSYIAQYNPNVLSHPWDDASSDGKEIWIQQQLEPQPQLVFLSGDKHKWATDKNGKPNVLIDDFDKYLVPWEQAGGIAVKHTSAEETIRQLEAIKNQF